MDEIKRALKELIYSADQEGCSDDLVVVSMNALRRLKALVDAEAFWQDQPQ